MFKKFVKEIRKKMLELHPNTNIGKIILSDTLEIECYVLENGSRVITKQGIQKTLGISNKNNNGFSLEDIILSSEVKKSQEKFEYFLPIKKALQNNFKSTSQQNTRFYDVEVLITICSHINRMKLLGFLPDELDWLHVTSEKIRDAFSKLGIIAFVDDATGYTKFRKQNEYVEKLKLLLSEDAGEWEKCFTTDFYEIFWKFWGNRKKFDGSKKQQFFRALMEKYVYTPLAKKTGIDNDASNSKNCADLVFGNIGKATLKTYLEKLTLIGRMSDTEGDFDRNLEKSGLFVKNSLEA